MAKGINRSNAGGVASRQGFEYQDHIAASFLIEMLSGGIVQVECETSDDISVIREEGGKRVTEFVQVKTTESDKKWTVNELCKISSKNSVYNSSFSHNKNSLSLDLFRIVTKRDVVKGLAVLTLERENRSNSQELSKLSRSIAKASKKWKSPAGNDSIYWVNNTLWQVQGRLESVMATNKRDLLRLAERFGVTPSHSENESLYDELVKMAYDAGNASRIHSPDKKIITAEAIRRWWGLKVEEIRSSSLQNRKPYTSQVPPFLIEFHSMSDAILNRTGKALEAGYERNLWRNKGLAEHMIEWLPEIALRASELSTMNHTNFLKFSERAKAAIRKHRTNAGEELVSEILLHICLRQTFKSEPIGCKVFYLTKSKKSKSFPNAHIVKSGRGTELWLGKSVIIVLNEFESSVKNFVLLLQDYLDDDFLKEERDVILSLKESQHMVDNTLDDIFLPNTSIDKLLEHLCIPVLIAYDSLHLHSGFIDDYKEKLIQEVTANFEHFTSNLPATMQKIKLHVFLLPFDDSKLLIKHFSNLLK